MSYKIVELDVGELKRRGGDSNAMNRDTFVRDCREGRLAGLAGHIAYCKGIRCGAGDDELSLLIAASDLYADVGPFNVVVYKIPLRGEDLEAIKGLMITRGYAVGQMNGESQSKKGKKE